VSALAHGHAVSAVVREADASMPSGVTTIVADVSDPKIASVVKRDHVIVGAMLRAVGFDHRHSIGRSWAFRTSSAFHRKRVGLNG
jgi:putative NADH-flavin reductase